MEVLLQPQSRFGSCTHRFPFSNTPASNHSETSFVAYPRTIHMPSNSPKFLSQPLTHPPAPHSQEYLTFRVERKAWTLITTLTKAHQKKSCQLGKTSHNFNIFGLISSFATVRQIKVADTSLRCENEVGNCNIKRLVLNSQCLNQHGQI